MSTFYTYLQLGIWHILDLAAYDHLLFITALVIGLYFKNAVQALLLATAFTIGHSLTLVLAVFKLVSFHADIVETLIPITIIATCIARMWSNFEIKKTNKVQYGLILIFGLIHGLGFSSFLQASLPESQGIGLPLLAFNLGIELAQIVIILAFLLLQEALKKALNKAILPYVNYVLAIVCIMISVQLILS